MFIQRILTNQLVVGKRQWFYLYCNFPATVRLKRFFKCDPHMLKLQHQQAIAANSVAKQQAGYG